MTRKALILTTHSASTLAGFVESYKYARDVLTRMGYQVDTMAPLSTSTWLSDFETSTKGYEFVVLCRLDSAWTTTQIQTLGNGKAQCPVFILGMRNALAEFSSQLGLTRVAAAGYLWATVSVNGRTFDYPAYGAQYTIDPAFATKTFPLAWNTATPANGIAWKFVGLNNNTYIDTEGLTGGMLPLLMQQAITDGKISPPPRKIPIATDIDDLPDLDFYTNLGECTAIYNLQLAYQMPITWGFVPNTGTLNNFGQDVIDFIKARTPDKGGLIYLIDHGADDWRADTATISANYETWMTNMQSLGLSTGYTTASRDNWGYRYFNVNQLGDSGMQLIAGYGHKVVRASVAKTDGTTKASRTSETDLGAQYSRGVKVVPGSNTISSTVKTLDQVVDLTSFATHMNLAFSRACRVPFISYLHGKNFYAAPNGNQPGLVIIRALGEICTACKDTVRLVQGAEVLY